MQVSSGSYGTVKAGSVKRMVSTLLFACIRKQLASHQYCCPHVCTYVVCLHLIEEGRHIHIHIQGSSVVCAMCILYIHFYMEGVNRGDVVL